MMYGTEKFFAPSYNIIKMRNQVLSKPKLLCKAFREHIYEYYIKPAKISPAFAQGVLYFTLIDFLAKIIITDIHQIKDYKAFLKDNFSNSYHDSKKIHIGERIVTFLIKEIGLFNNEDGYCFYKYVRNGLIHEGRVKCGCYLDNKIEHAVEKIKGVLRFNPTIVLNELESWLEDYFRNIKKGKKAYKRLRDYIEKILDEDLEAIKKRDKDDSSPVKNRFHISLRDNPKTR